MSKVRVLIAEDHIMVREGLKQIIELEEDIEVIDFASNGNEAIEKVDIYNPDILLLDINFPDISGLEVLRYFRNNNIDVKVLILTIHNDVEYLLRAVRIGVEGYIVKDSDTDTLIKAIRTIISGDTYIQPNMASDLFDRMNKNDSVKGRKEKLTHREFEVLRLITTGMLNKQIADELGISEKTVKNHVSNIFKKIKVSDRTQAAVFAIKNNYVEI